MKKLLIFGICMLSLVLFTIAGSIIIPEPIIPEKPTKNADILGGKISIQEKQYINESWQATSYKRNDCYFPSGVQGEGEWICNIQIGNKNIKRMITENYKRDRYPSVPNPNCQNNGWSGACQEYLTECMIIAEERRASKNYTGGDINTEMNTCIGARQTERICDAICNPSIQLNISEQELIETKLAEVIKENYKVSQQQRAIQTGTDSVAIS